jgi:hypothetical protein
MCGNYEFALEQARGEYVVFIGDDDAVIPGAIDDLLELLVRCEKPTIHMWPLHTYDWPANGRSAHVAYLAPVLARSELDLKSKALRVISQGGWKYYELPSPYHAAIPRAILDSVRDLTGRVFHSTQPDVFTAMAIPALADRAVNTGYSVTFNGRSARSNGLGFVEKAARSNIDRFLQEYGDYRFHPTLYPGAPSAANMIPDAILLAMGLFPDLYGATPFNYEAMWAFVCRLRLIRHSDVLKAIAGIRRHHEFRPPLFAVQSAIQECALLRRRIINHWAPPLSSVGGVPDNILEFARSLAADPRRIARGCRPAPQRADPGRVS